MDDLPDDDSPPLGYLLVRIAEFVDHAFQAALSEHDLRPRQFRLLVVVARHPGLKQRELAGRFGADAGNLVAMLDELDHRGLLERPRDQADRRQRLVSLTPQGERVLKAALRSVAGVEQEVVDVLPASSRRDYHRMTRAVYLHTAGRDTPVDGK